MNTNNTPTTIMFTDFRLTTWASPPVSSLGGRIRRFHFPSLSPHGPRRLSDRRQRAGTTYHARETLTGFSAIAGMCAASNESRRKLAREPCSSTISSFLLLSFRTVPFILVAPLSSRMVSARPSSV